MGADRAEVSDKAGAGRWCFEALFVKLVRPSGCELLELRFATHFQAELGRTVVKNTRPGTRERSGCSLVQAFQHCPPSWGVLHSAGETAWASLESGLLRVCDLLRALSIRCGGEFQRRSGN